MHWSMVRLSLSLRRVSANVSSCLKGLTNAPGTDGKIIYSVIPGDFQFEGLVSTMGRNIG